MHRKSQAFHEKFIISRYFFTRCVGNWWKSLFAWLFNCTIQHISQGYSSIITIDTAREEWTLCWVCTKKSSFITQTRNDLIDFDFDVLESFQECVKYRLLYIYRHRSVKEVKTTQQGKFSISFLTAKLARLTLDLGIVTEWECVNKWKWCKQLTLMRQWITSLFNLQVVRWDALYYGIFYYSFSLPKLQLKRHCIDIDTDS